MSDNNIDPMNHEPEHEKEESQRSPDGETGFLDNEASYVCNSCGEAIVVPLDTSGGQRQEYVEDCPVCCNPNVIHVEFDPHGRPSLWSRSEQDLS